MLSTIWTVQPRSESEAGLNTFSKVGIASLMAAAA